MAGAAAKSCQRRRGLSPAKGRRGYQLLYRKINFKKFTDGRGDLVPLEMGRDRDIPFDVKRCYFISNPTNDGIRGRHAHRSLEQVIVCLNGSFTLSLDDGKGGREDIVLDRDDFGIHIKDLVWRELKGFSEKCVILVLADSHYHAGDYIHDYNEFLKAVKGES
ncbi:MAG: FdtA/QdtA family cupin domain-containing protein [Thermodesulfobacteriota bacterium]